MQTRHLTSQPLAVTIAVAALLAGASIALAVCGDGVQEPAEQCDHGGANGLDDCCSATCTLVDTDIDGTCDALDPCQWGLETRLTESRIAFARLTTPPGDDSLRLSGRMTVPIRQGIDPSVSGVRLRMFASLGDPHGLALVDAVIPGGAGWSARAGGTRWTYRDASGRAAGIRRVDVKLLPRIDPRTDRVTVALTFTGKRGSYPLTPDMTTSQPYIGLPPPGILQVTVALATTDATADHHCGEAWYTSYMPTHCDFRASGDRATCMGPPPVGPCHIGDPDGLLLCDIANAVRGQEAYFAAHGAYATSCADLPGFVPSPGVLCLTTPKADRFGAPSFGVLTSNPAALRPSCVWDNDFPSPNDALNCS